jgi:hypothetical protein
MAIGLPRIGLGLNRGGSLEDAVRALFAASEQGFWLDPSDAATAFQTSTGTTAGVVGQPLGLRYDKRLGLTLGAELVASSTPDGVGWASQGTVSVAGSQITFGSQFANRRYAVAGLSSTKFYRFSFKARRISGNTAMSMFFENSDTGGDIAAITLTGQVATFSATVRGDPVLVNFGIQDRNAAGWGIVEMFDVSVRELPGNHAAQGTSPSRPVWNQDGAFYRDTFDGFDDSMSIAAGGGSTTGFFYCGAVNVAGGAGTARTIISDAGANTGYRLRINAANVLELAAGNGVSFTTAVTAGTLTVGNTYVVTAWHDGVNLNVQIGQGTVGQTAFGAVTAGTAGMTESKDNGVATSFGNVGLYNRMYRAGPVPSAAQRAAVQSFMSAKSGAAL